MIPLLSLFPIGDDNEGRTIQPYVTYILIAINIAVFVLLQGLGSNDAFTNGFSVVPREIMTNTDLYGRVPVEGGVLALTQGPQPIYLRRTTRSTTHRSPRRLFPSGRTKRLITVSTREIATENTKRRSSTRCPT